jgi:uncharacterized protein YndB with AHSA1/START domain
MTTSATTRSLVIEKEMPHAPEKIWRALTQGPLIKEWLMDNDFQPVVGHRFTFRTTPHGDWNGVIDSEVLVVEPHKKLSYRWDSLGVETTVVWTLQPTNAGTLLRMEQSGFGPDQQLNYKGAKYGWTKFIGAMEGVCGGLQ